MGGLRWTVAIAASTLLAWGALVACGSERPPPADSNPDPDASVGLDGGGPRVAREAATGTVQCPDIPLAIRIDPDSGRECVCRHRNSDGLIASIPCTYGLCFDGAKQGWFCSVRQELFYVEGVGTGTCDAAAVPPDAKPCDPGL